MDDGALAPASREAEPASAADSGGALRLAGAKHARGTCNQHMGVTAPLEPVEGWMHPPAGVGLGIEVVDEVVDHYRLDNPGVSARA